MAGCNGRLLLCVLVGLLCCTIEVESILLDHEHFLPAALDTVLSPYHHWRGKRGASSAETSHTSTSGGAADTGDSCQAAVGHLGAACVTALQKLPVHMEAANETLFVQAVERLCDDSACMSGLNDAFEACHQAEALTNHSALNDSMVGEFDSNMLAFVAANLSTLLHLGCLKNSNGDRCFGVLYRYEEREIACAMDAVGTTGHVCATSCQQNVSEIKNTVGCCYNSFFNTISNGSEPLSVWQACSVPDPGTCEVSSGCPVAHLLARSTMVLLLVAVMVGSVG